MQKKPSKPVNQEVYGLDVEFLEDLGLGDLIDELESAADEGNKTKEISSN